MRTFLAIAILGTLALNHHAVLGWANTCKNRHTPSTTLFMGRAAAVRAATKSKTDAKKAKTNARYGKKIIMAIKNGGGSGDPETNTELRDVIKQAKANSVPVDNINRVIKKATTTKVGDFSESTFEAYGFGGASMVVNVLTDNANRACADVKNAINKNSGKLAESGSVLFMYDRKTMVVVDGLIDEEELLDAAIEQGCDDYDLVEGEEEGSSAVLVAPSEGTMMVEAVKSMGFEDPKYSMKWITKAPVKCEDEDFEKNMQIIDALEDLDDVDSVEHNMSN